MNDTRINQIVYTQWDKTVFYLQMISCLLDLVNIYEKENFESAFHQCSLRIQKVEVASSLR